MVALPLVNKIIIAIDGYSATGKSTTAKRVAEALDYIFVDTGAMYRAVTLHCLRNGIEVEKETPELLEALDRIELTFVYDHAAKRSNMHLNGENVEGEIRSMAVSSVVSEVAAIPVVRRAMVKQQQAMGKEPGIVLDGRDIGTVVFPDAELKIFMTASLEKRIQRRQLQMKLKGVQLGMDEIRENLQHRDHIDSTRSDSPLRRAEDALVLDTTLMTIDQQVNFVLEYVEKIVNHGFNVREMMAKKQKG